MFKNRFYILIPITLGLIGGYILSYELDTYVPASSRIRVLYFQLTAYLISFFIPSILSSSILKNNKYKTRFLMSLISLFFLTLVNEINYWNNDFFPSKSWSSDPKYMIVNSMIHFLTALLFVLLVNIRISKTNRKVALDNKPE